MAEVFFSYSHHDKEYRDELEKHLAMLKHEGLIQAWHDRRIIAGDVLDESISEHLDNAQVILCLLSSNFLASRYCFDVEMQRAMDRHERNEARVIPVIIHPCDWLHSPLGKLRATPDDGKPISKFANPHDAYLNVVQDIRAALSILGVTVSKRNPRDAAHPHIHSQLHARSSNLRVKKSFSDQQKDEFIREGFAYITNYFDASLKELESISPHLKTRLDRTSGNETYVVIYDQGVKVSQGTLQRREHTIQMTNTEGSSANTYMMGQGALSLSDDGYLLGYQEGHGYGTGFGQSTKIVSHEGAAESFWSQLIAPLQGERR
ncbi:MAG: toll/interleukin-1 receptor domain-containing protein [Flavobacteriales bacterium]